MMSESIETKMLLDFQEGDLVQIVTEDHAGDLGKIVGIKLSTNEKFFIYVVYIKAISKMVTVRNDEIRFLSHDTE